MTTQTKPKATVRVRGVTYRSPDDAYAGAELLEHEADEHAAELRRSGKDGEADTLQDRGHAEAETLRSWARDREAADASAAEQPADRPTPRRRKSSSRRRSTPSRRGGSTLTPRTRSLASGTGIPQAGGSITSLLLQIAGLTLAIAFLTLLLTRRGVESFTSLGSSAANGLAWFLEPTDPLAPHTGAASATAARYARSGAATRPATGRGTHR